MSIFKIIIKAIVVAAICLSGIFWYLSPIFYELPKPTGIYGVGSMSYEFHDRPDLMIRCWYPTDLPLEPLNPYGNPVMNIRKIRTLSQLMHVPQLLLKNSFNFLTYSKQDALLSSVDEIYPVIFFIPGNGASCDDYTVLLEELASHCYIVMGINQSPVNPIVLFDGRFIENTQDFFSQKNGVRNMLNQCRENVSYCIDWLTVISNDANTRWYHRIDLQRLGIMGHSFGGSVAIEVARQDNRFAAGINLDGWLEMITTDKIPMPFLFLMNDSSFPPGKAEGMEEIQKTCAMSGEYCANQIVSGAAHNSFTDSSFYKWPFTRFGDPGTGDPYAMIKEIGQKVRDFLSIMATV